MLTDEELKRDNQRDVDVFNSRKYPTKNGIDCPFCHNKGFVGRLIDGEPYYTSCICTKDHEAVNNAISSGLGEYLKLSMQDFKAAYSFQSTMKQKALNFLKNPDRHWFVALGKNGT